MAKKKPPEKEPIFLPWATIDDIGEELQNRGYIFMLMLQQQGYDYMRMTKDELFTITHLIRRAYETIYQMLDAKKDTTKEAKDQKLRTLSLMKCTLLQLLLVEDQLLDDNKPDQK